MKTMWKVYNKFPMEFIRHMKDDQMKTFYNAFDY
jgi:hypothetical protein